MVRYGVWRLGYDITNDSCTLSLSDKHLLHAACYSFSQGYSLKFFLIFDDDNDDQFICLSLNKIVG